MLKETICEPSLLCGIVSDKMAYGLPLYRQQQRFSQLGVELSRQVMRGWMMGAAGELSPLKEALEREIRRCSLWNDNNIDEGYAIWLTNDHLYWSEPSKDSVGYFEFSVHQNATKKGELNWKQNINRVRLGKRKKKIILDGIYPINWEVYSNIEQVNNGLFKYSINRISH